MATYSKKRICRARNNNNNSICDFSKIGGLNDHLKLLREIIILPLLYGDLYSHFNIKAPRGVIFYGPPGTGKTLVAGALANEINKEGNGKVQFYQRKGADILDKWVGGSEKKLRELFDKAGRTRPSVIFFDELDGLAPERSAKNDQVHASVVATLLALMDGLDNTTGVVVIGATNRIDTIDPALRRPGRFDRELYFPLPSCDARKEILQVHTQSWKHRPSSEFLYRLAESTSGYCGSDLQALCTEAVLCCLKRKYPSINQKARVDIEVETLHVEEQDFQTARLNIVPTSQRVGNCRMRRLSPFIRPLLQRQIDKIVKHIQVLLPHFTQIYRKYLVGNERYAGRLVLKGNLQQGLNTHVIPAILQTLEHIQSYILDVPTQFNNIFTTAIHNLPSILVLSKVDDWWEVIDNNAQIAILTMLEGLHAGLPILLIATCSKDLPIMLHEHFYYNSSIFIQLDDPTSEEREHFFAPLFFSKTSISLYQIWEMCNARDRKITLAGAAEITDGSKVVEKKCSGRKRISKEIFVADKPIDKLRQVKHGRVQRNFFEELIKCSKCSKHRCDGASDLKIGDSLKYKRKIMTSDEEEYLENKPKQARFVEVDVKPNVSTAVTELVNCTNIMKNYVYECDSKAPDLYKYVRVKKEPGEDCDNEEQTTNGNVVDIYRIWKHVSNEISEGLPVVQLELLYDTMLACIYINKDSFSEVMKGLEVALRNFEQSCPRRDEDMSEITV